MAEAYPGEEMNIADTAVNVLLTVVIVFIFGFVCFSTLNKNETYLAATDCVGERWEEYEAMTGNVPPVELERTWYRECVDNLKG